MTQTPDKPSIDEVMAHFGTKGMKWGVRNDTKSSGSPRADRKAASAKRTNDILSARTRQQARGRKYQEAEGDLMVARTKKGQDKAEKVMRKLEKDFYLGKDASTAAKMTRGEKVTVGIVYGAMGVMAASLIATQKY